MSDTVTNLSVRRVETLNLGHGDSPKFRHIGDLIILRVDLQFQINLSGIFHLLIGGALIKQ